MAGSTINISTHKQLKKTPVPLIATHFSGQRLQQRHVSQWHFFILAAFRGAHLFPVFAARRRSQCALGRGNRARIVTSSSIRLKNNTLLFVFTFALRTGKHTTHINILISTAAGNMTQHTRHDQA
jgi:hypothetical protein